MHRQALRAVRAVRAVRARAGPLGSGRSMRACDAAPFACARRPRVAASVVLAASSASPLSSPPHARARAPLPPSAVASPRHAPTRRPAPASAPSRMAVVAAATAAAAAAAAAAEAGGGAAAAAATAAEPGGALPPHHRSRGPPSDDDYSSSSSTDEDTPAQSGVSQGARGSGGSGSGSGSSQGQDNKDGGGKEDNGGDDGDDGADDDPPSSKNPRVEYLGALGGGAMLTVRGRLSLPLDGPDDVYRVLSDYDRCPEVFASTVVHASSDRSATDGSVAVVQGARWRVLGFSGSFDVRLVVQEDPEARTLVFRLVESAFLRGFEGRWAVRPRKGGGAGGGKGRGCVVEHVLAVEPSVPLPRPIAAVASVLFTRQVNSLLADLRAEMERQRWGGGGGGGGGGK